MLVGPGFHAKIFKLADQFVSESLISRRTGLVAAAGKFSVKGGFKKIYINNEAREGSDCLDGVWVGIYAKRGSKLAAETFSLSIFFTSSQSMRGITLS